MFKRNKDLIRVIASAAAHLVIAALALGGIYLLGLGVLVIGTALG